jgi:hypothetical protein
MPPRWNEALGLVLGPNHLSARSRGLSHQAMGQIETCKRDCMLTDDAVVLAAMLFC